MCYSGRCIYENHMGDCRVNDYKEIKNITGHSACYIGEQLMCEEEEKCWNRDYELGNITKWRNQIRDNGLTW